jgi:LytS/YehU family sensor histidine kinase
MESLRFEGKFHHNISLDLEKKTDEYNLPPMLIQPYLENAIWHGLMHQSDEKEKRVDLTIKGTNSQLTIRIEDNGIGREKAAEIKAKKNQFKESAGMEITGNRISLINKMYNADARINVIDMYDENNIASGTLVEINLNSLDDQGSYN